LTRLNSNCSQFSDIYQEEYFINYLKDDVRIVKELPLELQSLDLEAIGSLVSCLHSLILKGEWFFKGEG
jgi:hypothetical protein